MESAVAGKRAVDSGCDCAHESVVRPRRRRVFAEETRGKDSLVIGVEGLGHVLSSERSLLTIRGMTWNKSPTMP